jgi:hypothetical protein
LPKEVWEWESRRALTRKQADGFQPRKPRDVPKVYDRDAVKDFLSGRIDREEMLRRIRR